jgi:hypothetical protein
VYRVDFAENLLNINYSVNWLTGFSVETAAVIADGVIRVFRDVAICETRTDFVP